MSRRACNGFGVPRFSFSRCPSIFYFFGSVVQRARGGADHFRGVRSPVCSNMELLACAGCGQDLPVRPNFSANQLKKADARRCRQCVVKKVAHSPASSPRGSPRNSATPDDLVAVTPSAEAAARVEAMLSVTRSEMQAESGGGKAAREGEIRPVKMVADVTVTTNCTTTSQQSHHINEEVKVGNDLRPAPPSEQGIFGMVWCCMSPRPK